MNSEATTLMQTMKAVRFGLIIVSWAFVVLGFALNHA